MNSDLLYGLIALVYIYCYIKLLLLVYLNIYVNKTLDSIY